MKVEKDLVVSMHYSLRDDDGTLLDSSEGKDPLQFIFGNGMIIPGLERALEGKQAGDSLEVAVAPADGYGEYDDKRVISVEKSQFQDGTDIRLGMQVQASDPEGGTLVFSVTSVEGESVTLDGNHPLAGRALNFSVSVEDVRKATSEELDHGHVH